MFIENLIESKRSRESRKRWLTLPVSISIHTLIVATLIIASYWFITDAVEFPPLPMVIVIDSIPVPPAPELAGRPQTPKAPEVKPKEPEQVFQPTDIPKEIPPQEVITPNDMSGNGGSPNGSPYGVPGGDPNGVPGGSESGQSKGLLPPTKPEDTNEILVWTPQMKKPVQIRRVEPQYPRILITARVEGTVVITAIIGKEGDVESAEVVKGVHPMLDREALEAVMQWKYTPAMLDGRPVKVFFTVTVTFSIH